MSAFVYKGHGIGLLPAMYCEQQIKTGEIVRVLPKWTSQEMPAYVVYPSRKFMPPKLIAFLTALTAWNSPFWKYRAIHS